MASGCPRCGDSPAIGVLCKSCASAVPTAESLIPDHVTSRLARAGSSRPAVLAVIAFFLVGGALLTRVDVAAGQRAVADQV